MMQSLAEVEPVALDASFECALGLSGQAGERPFPVPLADPGVAERFESTMADDRISPPDFRRMVFAFDSPEPAERVAPDAPKRESAVFRRFEEKTLCWSAHVVEELPERTGLAVEDSPDAPVRVVGNRPENKVHAAGDLPKTVERTIGHSPEKAVNTVEDRPVEARRVVRAESERLPVREVRVAADRPEGLPVREVRVAKSTLPEQAQIIAPAPLPIEMPVATVLRQQPASPAPSDAVRTFVAAAEAVADAILVSSGFADGEGSVIVRLQPEVLGGSEVRIAAKDGTLTVVVNAATQDVQEMVEANRVRFEQHLSEKVHSWRISVAVRRGGKLDERI